MKWQLNWKWWTAVGVLFSVVCGVLGVATWVLSSDWGLHWALQQASARLPGTLNVQTHQGRLRGPILLEDVSYKQDGMEVHLARVELEWDPWHLLRYEFHITRATLTEVDYKVVPSTIPATEILLADVSLPLTISAPQLDIKSLRLITQAEQPPLVIDSIHLAARAAGSVVDIEQLDISAAQFSLNVSGQLQTRERYPLSLNTAWSVRLPQRPELPELKGQGSFSGDLSAITLTQELITPLKLSVQGTLHDALKTPQWKITLLARGIDPRVLDPRLTLMTLNSFDLELTAQNKVGAADAIETQGVVRSTQAEVGAFTLQWNARYQNAHLTLNSVEARLAGTDTHVSLQAEVDLNAQAPNGIAQLNAHGQWQKLSWPLRQDAASSAGVHSPSGEFSIAGTTEDYNLKLSAALHGDALPNSEIKISGTGQAQAITLQTLDIATLGGAVSGNAAVQWNDGVRWQAHLQAAALNPGLRWSEWPGLLGFEINSDGAVKNNRVRAVLSIPKSSGKLRGHPLQVHARVGLDNNVYTVHSAELRSGKAMARVRGSIGDDWSLDWEVDAPELAAVYPDLLGNFSAAGKIRGPRDAPRVSYSAQGQQLRYATYTLTKLESHGDVDLNAQRPTQIIARAQKLYMDKGASAAVDEINFNLEGSLGQHRVNATLRAPDASVDISLAGQWRNAVWAGQLERANVEHRSWGAWKLAQAVAWSANATRAQAAETCWLGTSGRACAQASWAQVEGIKAQVAVADYPLAALKPLLPPDVALIGVLSATLQAHLPPHERIPARLNTRLQVQLTPGVLSILGLGNEAVNFEHHGGGLNVETDAQGARGEANLDFAQLGNAALNAQLPGWHLERTAAQQPLIGKLRADVRTLKFLARWVPALEQTQGMLNAEVNLAGSLAEPQYAGRVTLNDGAAALPQLGIRLSKVSLDVHHRDAQHLEFRASASSGPGQVDIHGEVTLDRAAGWPVTAEIKGKDFEAVNLPEAWVLASPELQVYKAHSRIDLNGLLLIPQARYTARDISTVQTPSGDVVLVNADNKPRIDNKNASPAPAGNGNDEKLKIYTTVRFSFGDQVSFDGFGLKGLIRGEVVAFDEPKKLTTGYGELQIVDATFNAYKIDLKVTRGRLLFAGGQINNPGIDARAIREAGTIRQVDRKDKPSELRESGADVAGALVRGTLRKFELTLFSEPPRDQADVLSLLLFGVPLGDATSEEGKALFLAASSLRLSGQDETLRKIGRRFGIDEIRLNAGSTPEQAALVIGRYLGPRLYINYSVGLLTSGSNVLRFRYRVSSKWILQSEQSDAESAADLLYTFER